MTPDIIVSHPGVQHSYMLVLAVQEIDRLDKFITSFYYKKNSVPYFLLTKYGKIQKYFNKRFSALLDQSRIVNMPYYELVEQFSRLAFGNAEITNNLIYWRDRAFDYHVSHFHLHKKIRTFIGYPNASLRSFTKIKQWDGHCILDLPIGYYKEAEEILEAEKKLHPEFADSITYTSFDETYKKRVDAELTLADNIVIPSDFAKRTLVKHGFDESKLRLIPYGSYFTPNDISSVRKSNPGEPVKLLYAGQISQRKGIKYLLEAARELKKRGVHFELTLVGRIYGKGSGLQSYQQFFKYIPYMGRDDLKKLFLNSDLFIFPSLFEGSGLVIFEALSNALPVITTANTCAEAIKDNYNGFIVSIRDPQQIVDKVMTYYTDRDFLNQAKINALKSSYHYSWVIYRKKWQELLSN